MSSENENNPEARARGYIYAFLAFVSVLGKAQADVQHLWIGRRACTRIRSELMASIYAKALVRKDYSGIIQKTNEEQANSTDKGKSAEAQSNTRSKSKDTEGKDGTKNTSGADVGKIVQLMSGDANRIAMMISGAYFIYVSLQHRLPPCQVQTLTRRMRSREHPWKSP